MTALSATVTAAFLLACSSDASPSSEQETASANPTDPNKPGASGPSTPGTAPGTTPGTAAAPDSDAAPPPAECKRTEPSKACGVSPQCGCASGKTCDVVDVVGNARCVTAGTSPMGHACGGSADCAVGLTCVFGTCHAFCNNPGNACAQPGTGACVQVTSMEGDDVPNLAVCRIACAPHDPASCGGSTEAGPAVCHVDGEGNTECQSGGSRTEGDTCSPTDECGPGLACVSSKESSTCKRWCRVGEKDCGSDASCAAFSPAVNVRGVAYGSCS